MKSWLRMGQLARTSRFNALGAGYTVIEVIIVLAVTTALFVSIATTFAGQQARTEFTQTIRTFEAKLQNVMNDVRAGLFPSGIQCTRTATGPLAGGTVNPGSNSDCIFIGKLFQQVPPNVVETKIKTLVGLRLNSSGNDVTNLTDAMPAVFGPEETYIHPFQLEVRRIVNLANNANIFGLVFAYRLSGGIDVGSAGSDPVFLYGLTSSGEVTGSVPVASLTTLPSGALLCVRGVNDYRAEITIGGSNSQTTINSLINTQNAGVCFE